MSDNDTGGILLSNEDPSNGHRGIELGIYNREFEVILSSGEPDSPDFPLTRIKVKVRAQPDFPRPGWQHLFATYDGQGKAAGAQLYLDGVRQRPMIENDAITGPIDTEIPLRIGGRSPGILRHHGAIDDVRVYDRCLEQAEVQQLYRLGLQTLVSTSADARTPQQSAALAAYYRLQDQQLPALRAQQSAADAALLNARIDGGRRWFINSHGQTMVLVSYRPQHGGTPIDHNFAISAYEVTVAEFLRFRGEHEIDDRVAPSGDCPAHHVNWYQAAEYCNWLSEQEQIPEDQWVYLPNDDGQYASGMGVKQDYLRLTGYRLPTAAEWKYACRAGASGSFGFGEPVQLLRYFGWYGVNSTGRSHAVGHLLPNDLGLFDMHGNLWEWCQSPRALQSSWGDNDQGRRIRCGGAFLNQPMHVSTDLEHSDPPGYDSTTIGFRPIRTSS